MHVHELNPWRTLIALSLFVALLIVGFVTMHRPLLTYKLGMKQSVADLNKADAFFYPWQLDSFLKKETHNIVLFDIRNNFTYGQGHIPGSENMSASDLTQEDNIKRMEALKDKGVTVVLYGNDQLQATGPWMLFRQVGFGNVKVLLGGYQYYFKHKDNLASAKNDTTFLKGHPRYDFAKITSQKGNTGVTSQATKKPVIIHQRKKADAVAGGC